MRPPHSILRSLLLGSTTLALLVLVAPSPTVAAAPEQPPPPGGCWNVKTTICTDCPDEVSKYCDPRASDGPFAQCVQAVSEPCAGYTCSQVDAELGPPCD